MINKKKIAVLHTKTCYNFTCYKTSEAKPRTARLYNKIINNYLIEETRKNKIDTHRAK